MSTPALKPCPFCGGTATLEDQRLMWAARCTSCGACVLGDRAPEPEDEMPEAYWESFRRSAVDRWNRRATPPAPEVGEPLAARPLLEKVARLGDCIGQQTVAQVQQLAEQASAWLRDNPPGQPVAIEPRGCPTPGACSCVEPAPPAPEPGKVGELWALAAALRDPCIAPLLSERTRAATLLQQQAAPAPAVAGECPHCGYEGEIARAPQAGEGEG